MNKKGSPGNGGPLADVRVLDISRVLAGPWSTTLLSDLGAEVIKVEEPGVGDQTRHTPPSVNGQATHFTNINRNKKSVAVDLKSEGGKQLVYDLARVSDVVVENFRPGVADRLGFGYERMSEINPRIIYCSVSGFGQTGPLRDRPSYDVILQAFSGAMSVTGEVGAPPVRLGIPLGDLSGGIYGALGVLAALHEREKTGRGTYIDVSIYDAMFQLMVYYPIDALITGKEPLPVGGRHHHVAPYGTFKVKDGYFVLAILQTNFWVAFCNAVERPDLIVDPRFKTAKNRYDNRAILYPIMDEIMLRKTRAEWSEVMTEAGVPNAPIQQPGDAARHPHTQAREMIQEVEHPAYGKLPVCGRVIKFRGHVNTPLKPAALLGENTEDVMRDTLGYSESRIKELVDSKAVALTKLPDVM